MDDSSWTRRFVDDKKPADTQRLEVNGEAEAPPKSSTRRTFLRRATALTLAIPGLGAALESCSSRESGSGTTADTTEHETGSETTATRRDSLRFHNPDSKLDTSLKRGAPKGLSATHPTSAAASTVYTRFDPRLPPLRRERSLKLHFHAREVAVRISQDTVVAGWTFEGNIPGPLLHCRVGDTVHFTLTNDAEVPHSMDFHAAQIDPRTAFRSAMKGQSVSYQFTPRRAGAFCYHCGTAPVLMHI
ncbi:MAG: multicopper oxidase domain-containing protein, partial [Gemmatimonadaceae bacterium]